jgi:hypothetical protein
MKYFLVLLLISTTCFAYDDGETFLGYGVGVFNDAKYYPGQNKYGEIGLRSFLFQGIYLQNKLGYEGEGSPDKTRKSGFWGSSGPGMEIDLRPIEMRAGGGLGFISNPDSQLGGVFPQFNTYFAIGVRDRKGDGMAFEYNHLSSAGLASGANEGRDFVILELSQKW